VCAKCIPQTALQHCNTLPRHGSVLFTVFTITYFMCLLTALTQVHCMCLLTALTQVHFLCLLTALTEARDISLHLRPLRLLLVEIEQVDFLLLPQYLAPLMHVVCLVWSHSKYYCTPGRTVVLLQEICNLLIDKVINIFIFISVSMCSCIEL